MDEDIFLENALFPWIDDDRFTEGDPVFDTFLDSDGHDSETCGRCGEPIDPRAGCQNCDYSPNTQVYD